MSAADKGAMLAYLQQQMQPISAAEAEAAMRSLVEDALAALEPDKHPNVLLKAVAEPWPFDPQETAAPASVVGVDLVESDDPRSRRTGEELLCRVEASWST